ncbi:hypothetical protein COOONC_04530 [Cooperia oncophora]
MHSVVSGLTGRVIRTRRQLLSDLEGEVGELSEPDWVANQLTALALLRGTDYEQLLDIYLTGRKNFIAKLTNESSSLLNVVTELKKTLVVVEQLFAQGELVRIIQAAACPTYRPALIDSLISDEAFTFGRMLTAEAEKVTRQLRDFKASPILMQKINSKCTEWINDVCNFAREPVMSICEFYDKADDIIEFLHAICGVLRTGWPRMIPYSTVYQDLFGNVLFKKFTGIISRDLRNLEEQLIKQLKSINTAPPPLFEKTSNKFDPLMGIGISAALQECILKFYVGVQNARECCGRYEQVELDSQPERGIISRDLRNLEEQLIKQLKSINTAPPPLFEKTSNKFDPLMGIGISAALQECILKFYVGVQNARECCGRYEQVELDSQPERVRESLAAELFAVIERLSKLHPNNSGNISMDELSRTRLCLALLHCDSTSFCQAMNKDGERIAAASRLLNAAAEDSLRYIWVIWVDVQLHAVVALN